MREIIISVYLIIIRILYQLFKLFPIRSQTICIVTYGDNVWPILEQLSLRHHRSYCFYDIHKASEHRPERREIIYKPLTVRNRLIVIPFLVATSTHCIVDNYVAELAAIPIRKRTVRFQVWHAAGTLKLFGLQATQNLTRSSVATNRFRKVYSNYGYFIVSGIRSAQQFAEAHQLPMSQFKFLGVPRTDNYYSRENRVEKKERIVLYAPTYRENAQFDVTEYIQKMHTILSEQGYNFIVKLHPSVNVSSLNTGVDFIDPKESILPYLQKAEWVITDYSSIPFEACLFNSKVILFVPDFEEYAKIPGVVSNFETIFDVPIVRSSDEVIDAILHDRHGNLDCASQWYDLEPGKATERIIKEFY